MGVEGLPCACSPVSLYLLCLRFLLSVSYQSVHVPPLLRLQELNVGYDTDTRYWKQSEIRELLEYAKQLFEAQKNSAALTLLCNSPSRHLYDHTWWDAVLSQLYGSHVARVRREVPEVLELDPSGEAREAIVRLASTFDLPERCVNVTKMVGLGHVNAGR